MAVAIQQRISLGASSSTAKDARWGHSLHVALAGDGAPSENEVRVHLTEQFGPAGSVKGFLYLPELPLLGIGKVDRGKLSQLATEATH